MSRRYRFPNRGFGASLAVALWMGVFCAAAQDQDPGAVELKRCMAEIELIPSKSSPAPDLVACLETAGETTRQPAFEAASSREPARLPDGRRYRIVGATRFEIYAELKGYPDEAAIDYVGEKLREMACGKRSDAILKAGISCGLCPDRQDLVPCVFAHGHFVVWVDSKHE